MTKYNAIESLEKIGFSNEDATALRRISMTLGRWHELECGDSNNYASWCVVRGKKNDGEFVYDDNGEAYEERHVHTENKARYTKIADRERGAHKRLKDIMSRYADFVPYIQTDPRGCALYILRSDDVAGKDISSIYTRGVPVCK